MKHVVQASNDTMEYSTGKIMDQIVWLVIQSGRGESRPVPAGFWPVLWVFRHILWSLIFQCWICHRLELF